MSTLVIRGRRPLAGVLHVAGSKNSALPLIAAAAASARPWRLTNVPRITDVDVQLSIFEALGGSVSRRGSSVTLVMPRPPLSRLPEGPARKLRASILFVPALLARTGQAVFPHPGGCVIGARPIDVFLEGFRALGVRVQVRGDVYTLRGPRRVHGTYAFPVQSHTGTETLLTLAALGGRSVLENVALEPEVAQLISALTMAGARVRRNEQGTRLEVRGAVRLGGATVRVIPDRIEAGTFLALATLAGPTVTVSGANRDHLTVPLAYLARMGVTVKANRGNLQAHADNLKAIELKTHEYPGFPTDLQSPFSVLLTQARGISLIHETLYEGRLVYLDKLRAMGAKVLLADPHRAIIEGPTPLSGSEIEGPDIRAGIALVLAGLIARGTTRIDHAELIDRGYERIVERLTGIGAHVERRA